MLQLSVDWLVYIFLGFSGSSRLAGVIDFFIYDSIKILLLLFAMISVIGFLRTFLPQRKIKAWLGKSGGGGNLFAALFGAATPFCSCSSIPIFLSFIKAGIPLGIAFSFLVASPLINEYLVVLMLGFFGWKITLAYVISGVIIAVVSGSILGRMNLERHLVEDMVAPDTDEFINGKKYQNFIDRVIFGISEAVSIVKKIWVWILVGVGIGALIHNYIPQEAVQGIAGKAGIFSVPVATLIGIPMYGSCAAILPIAVVLFQKGFPLGTALAFMMAVSALSLPEAVMLRRAMKLNLIAIFFGITALAIILTGYLFNILQRILV
ncbi:MAG: permease [Candidatus Omnitrophota bacterium]|nr:permease [Candidatus Omnitrophota bacterium]MBU1928926.1 permease [Candidatus Omnitrophota bacterium]MBU2035349.1 permease [Candidatus Omnitrophota bacterium]MBU2258747.1 permease [Candidatus Omnitrophota bacterium]